MDPRRHPRLGGTARELSGAPSVDRPDTVALALASTSVVLFLVRLALGRLVRLLLQPHERHR